MKLLEHQKRLLDEIRSNPTERHGQLLPDGSLVGCVECEFHSAMLDARTVQRLGLGTHAEVYEARIETEFQDKDAIALAVKVEKPIRQSSGFLLKEIEILKALSEVGVSPKYLGIFTVQIAEIDCLSVGMELFDESLSSLKTRKDLVGDRRTTLLQWLTLSMFECASKMHDCGFLHRDIKPSNFMYKRSADGCSVRVVLIDFGSSVSVGETNDSPFRGTGAYASLSADPLQSHPIDDLWSVAWSILELSLESGLPWRSISARSDEGREELFKQKLAMLERLSDGPVEGVTELSRTLICCLHDVFRGDSSIADFRALLKQERTDLKISPEVILDALRPPSYRRLHNRKIPPVELLLNSHHRPELLDSSSRAIPFENNKIHSGIASAVAAVHAIDSPDHLLVDAERICITDLLTSACELRNCPLKHLPQTGIERSAIARQFRKSPVCIDSLARKCRIDACKLRHMDGQEILELFAVKRRRLFPS